MPAVPVLPRLASAALPAVAGAVLGVVVALLVGAGDRGGAVDVGFVVGAVLGAALGWRRPRRSSAAVLAGAVVAGVGGLILRAAPAVGTAALVAAGLLTGFIVRRHAAIDDDDDHGDEPAVAVTSPRRWVLGAGIVGAVGVVVHGLWSVTRHLRYGSGSWDYGCYVHNAWLFASGAAFDVDARSAVLGDVAFWGGTNHFMPSLVVTAPLGWLMRVSGDTAVLAMAQVVVVVAAVVPLALAAHKRGVTPLVSTTIAAAFIFHLGTQAALFFDVHEVALVPALLLAALVVVDNAPSAARILGVVVLVVLLGGTKEGSWLYVASFGALLVVARPGWRRVGAAIVVSGVVGFVVVVTVIQPALIEPGAQMIHAARFVAVDDGGSGIGPAIRSWLMHPGRATASLLLPVQKAATLSTSMLGLAFLPVLSAEAIVLALPNLVERFLADKREMWGLAFHYGLVTATYLAWGAVDVAGQLHRRRIVSPTFLAALIVVSTVTSFVVSPRAPDLAHLEQPYFASAADVARFDRALAVIDDVADADAAVVAQNHLLPHLAARAHIWLPE
ncbi:MAG TPA: DUF2079 domain-containing protein, partial [Myxococcota bacterium]